MFYLAKLKFSCQYIKYFEANYHIIAYTQLDKIDYQRYYSGDNVRRESVTEHKRMYKCFKYEVSTKCFVLTKIKEVIKKTQIMERITYLSHCGYAVTLDDVILVFDYLHDPSHSLKHILERNPDKPVVFFISHMLVNNNHFNPGTFEIAQNHRKVYVVSNSVPAMYIPSTLEVQGVSHGDVVEDLPGHVSVKVYGTPDKNHNKGVCFMVTTSDGKKIFHGGHLNEWDLPDETSKNEARNDDEKFRVIVDRIAQENPVVDVAMFAVDPRISLDFARGARILAEKIKIKDFFPMAVDGDFKEAFDFSSYLPAGTNGHAMRAPGESIEL